MPSYLGGSSPVDVYEYHAKALATSYVRRGFGVISV